MSALTDLFTALANKIRSNLGGSDTYTPIEMVDAVDDVYDAGEAAGIAATKVGDAATGDVLSGKTFTNSTTVGATGAMTNNGAVSPSGLDCGESYTIPEGYHNGSGAVTANSLSSQTGVDTGKTAIDASHVLDGYQGWVNGSKVSGTYTPPPPISVQASQSATAGTSAVTVTPDTGYDAMAEVVVSPTPSETKTEGPNVSTNKEVTPTSGKLLSKVTITPQTHTGTYTPAANTAANDMGANHDKRYVNTSGMIVPSGNKAITSNGTGIDVSSYATASVSVSGTSITPSNSSPASMSSGSLYTPSASGYAISSYSNTTPSNSSPVSLSSGSIHKMGGSGYAISSYSSVTPSNSSPVSLSSGSIYKMGGAGKAVASVTDITPSNSSPVSMSSGSVYKAGGNGYAISSYSSLTPSNTAPASMSSGSIYKAAESGYAISTYSSASKTPSTTGTAFSSGWNRMTSSGYAYSAKPEGTETLLWTNPSPTSAYTYGSATVPNITQYDYLKFVIRRATTQDALAEYIVSVDDFKDNYPSVSSAYWWEGFSMTVTTSSGTTQHIRRARYESDTSIYFSTDFKYTSTSIEQNNNSLIPYQIYGIKSPLRPTPGFEETTLWTNSAPTSNFTDTTVTLSDSMENYDYLQFEYKNQKSNSTATRVIMSVADFKQTANSTGSNSLGFCTAYSSGGNSYHARRVHYSSATQIRIRGSYYINGSGGTDAVNIPLTIKGLKFK